MPLHPCLHTWTTILGHRLLCADPLSLYFRWRGIVDSGYFLVLLCATCHLFFVTYFSGIVLFFSRTRLRAIDPSKKTEEPSQVYNCSVRVVEAQVNDTKYIALSPSAISVWSRASPRCNHRIFQPTGYTRYDSVYLFAEDRPAARNLTIASTAHKSGDGWDEARGRVLTNPNPNPNPPLGILHDCVSFASRFY